MLFPDAWERFLKPIPEAERSDLITAYHRRLTSPDRAVQVEAASAWSQWEGDTISIRGPASPPPASHRPEAECEIAHPLWRPGLIAGAGCPKRRY